MKVRWIRELFSFSRKERTGIIGLLFIIFILILIGKLIPLFISSDNTDFSKWEAEVDSYLAKRKGMNPVSHALRPAFFNPNEIDSVELVNMGLPPRVIANWMKYLERGGQFRDKEGVKKIFGMTPGLFDQLDRFIVIPAVKTAPFTGRNEMKKYHPNKEITRDSVLRHIYPENEKKRIAVQELNGADSLHLLDIPGIGPVFASRIIRYRNLLGGYYAVSQLREVYGMQEEHFTAVSSFFTADPSTVRTFNINFSNIHELGRHPYIGFRTARKITRLRDKIGKFSTPEDLSSVVEADSLKRLIPYVKFNQ